MDVLFEMTWPGDPVPKGRPRANAGGRVYTPARTRNAEEALRAAVNSAYADDPYEGAVGVGLQFYTATRRRSDGDNLQKLVWDCLQRGRQKTGGVILDDFQVEESYFRVYRKADNESPRTEIVVYALRSSEE
jgi:Holliday junction resolvase RusA-like endonuclease